MLAPVYTTKAWLTEAGIQVSSYADDRLNRLLVRTSSFVDRLTAQRFFAYEETVSLSGDDRPILFRSDFLPILSVSSVTVKSLNTNRRGRVFLGDLADVVIPGATNPYADPSYPSTTTTFVVDKDFVLRPDGPLPRYLDAINKVFPGGSGNIDVTGVFGWVEPGSRKNFSTTTTTTVTPTSTSVTLASVAGLELRDQLIIGNTLPVIVTAINSTTNVVNFDPPTGRLTTSIASGATAKSWGATPYDIEWVIGFLINRELARQAQWASSSPVDPTVLRRERTDQYEYEVFSPAQMNAFGKGVGVTGIPEVDEILINYTAPPVVYFA